MRWHSVLFLLMTVGVAPVYAGPVETAIARSVALTSSGQAAEAVRCCLEARVEYPESAPLLFALAGAEIALGDEFLRQHAAGEAVARYQRARDTFRRAAEKDATRYGEAAAYNAATCLLRVDQAYEGSADYAVRVANLAEAVAALETVLQWYPHHERATKNLDYARYRWNLLRQNPPTEDTPPEDEKDEDEPQAVSEVSTATTDLPNATAEVIDGSTVVLRISPPAEDAP